MSHLLPVDLHETIYACMSVGYFTKPALCAVALFNVSSHCNLYTQCIFCIFDCFLSSVLWWDIIHRKCVVCAWRFNTGVLSLICLWILTCCTCRWNPTPVIQPDISSLIQHIRFIHLTASWHSNQLLNKQWCINEHNNKHQLYLEMVR